MPKRSCVLAAPLLAAAALVACGGGGSTGTDGGMTPDGTFGCSSVPSCYADALAATKACVPAPALTLVPVTPSSGVIDGLTCTSSGVDVAFSTFSASQGGTVPLPSGVTLKTGSTTCAVLGSGKGTSTDGQTGTTRSFTFTSFKVGTNPTVQVSRYDDGSFTIQCGPSARDEVTAAAGALGACPDAVQTHRVVRNADASQMGVEWVNAAGTASTLFTCN